MPKKKIEAPAVSPEKIRELQAREWLSKNEFVFLYPLSKPSLDRYLRDGRLIFKKIGGRVLVKNIIP